MTDFAAPLTDEQLRAALVEAIEADALKPHSERAGLVNVMIAVVQPELDRLRAENQKMRAIQAVQTARFESILLIPDRDPASADNIPEYHGRLGYNTALRHVHDALGATTPTIQKV
jgi:hypothetical protein